MFNSRESKRFMRFSFLATAVGLLVSSPVLAFGLTDSDFDYLATQHIARDSAVIKGLSPKEQARLHAIIIDATTSSDPVTQAKNVDEAMAAFQEHQRWEETHPGQLWDAPKR
jgi:hypothetical protein